MKNIFKQIRNIFKSKKSKTENVVTNQHKESIVQTKNRSGMIIPERKFVFAVATNPIYIPRYHTIESYRSQQRRAKKNKRRK